MMIQQSVPELCFAISAKVKGGIWRWVQASTDNTYQPEQETGSVERKEQRMSVERVEKSKSSRRSTIAKSAVYGDVM